MADTINTPFGAVKKETAYVIGGALVLVLGVVWYRSRSAAKAASIAASGANTGIDPATGFAYGSAEDAAALANQGSFINPTVPFAPGGGGGGGSSIPQGFVSNAQWAQSTEQYLIDNGVVHDSTLLGNAIGKYLTGQPVTSDMQSLIQQAIAFGGYPPVAGPNGYPPSINTAPTPPEVHPPAAGTTHVTKAGDTLNGIAVYYGRSVQEIQNANPSFHQGINEPLPAGLTVIIPVVYRTF
jgi:LysM repeat protein